MTETMASSVLYVYSDSGGITEYLWTPLTNRNCVHEETKSRFNSGNALIHLVQNLLSSHMLSKNVKIKI